MSPRKPGLPICQHIAAGEQLLAAREQILAVSTAVQNAYPRSARVSTQAQRALDEVDKLRSELDNVSAQENPDGDTWSPVIYYGANRDAWEAEVRPLLAWHQQDNPPCCTGGGYRR
jgi:hypothetical protein